MVHPSHTQRRPAKVLLVEDSESQALLVKIAIGTSQDLELIYTAQDGEEAMMYLRGEGEFENKLRPDLVLLDLNMPRKNGFEVLEEVKSDPTLRSIPIIILTTSDTAEDVAKAYQRGASSFLTKPIGFDELRMKLQSFGNYWSIAELSQSI